LPTEHPQPFIQIIPEEDARLIAAAPDMLAALKVLVDAWGDSDVEVARSAICQAEDAIAKAEGGGS
jgi:hypothetical protein